MPYHDLNVIYTPNQQELLHTLSFHQELGYQTIALAIPITGDLPTKLPVINIPEITTVVAQSHSPSQPSNTNYQNQLPPQYHPTPLKLYTRLTLTVSDTSQNHRITTLHQTYDIIALRPTDEKTFQTCCTSLECDIITIDLSKRLDFILRFTTVSAALQRGIRFEICYSPGIANGTQQDARRNLISGAASLIRAARGKGIIISSEAKCALGVRAPNDVINLMQVWGLSRERGREGIVEETDKVLRLARLKRESYRGVVDILDGGGVGDEKQNVSGSTKGRGIGKEQGVKRKASNTPLAATPGGGNYGTDGSSNVAAVDRNGRVLSKNAIKRAKKAKMEAAASAVTNNVTKASSGFPILHESLRTQAQNKS